MIRILFAHYKKKLLGDNEAEITAIKNDYNKIPVNKEEKEVAAVKFDKAREASNDSEKSEFYGEIATAECMEGEINDVFTIIEKDTHHFACVKNLHWNLCVGDKVKVTTERDDDNEVIVVAIEPKRRRDFEFGRLTTISFEKGYAVFEDKTLLLFSATKNIQFPLKIHEEYKYEAVE